MIVYVDVLIALNFVIDYLLLLVSQRLCCARFSRARLLLAALAGSLGSLVIFLPPMGTAGNIACKTLLSVSLVLIAGGFHGARGFLRHLFMLLAASFVFAGFMLFVTLFSGGRGGFYQNGVCYFNISAVKLLALSAAAYAGMTVYQSLFRRGMAGEERYRVEITAAGRTCTFDGVMDSQNRLVDLFSGTPVVVGPAKLLAGILPPGVRAAVASDLRETGEGVRLIPLCTVAGQEVLPAFRPERMVLKSGEKEVAVDDVYIAVAASLDSAGTQQLILNPALCGRVRRVSPAGEAGR